MVLTADHLSLSLGQENREILREASFSLGAGETVLLAGPSGAGKTALGMALCGWLPLWAGIWGLRGDIALDGEPVEQGKGNPGIGLILENPYTQLSGLKSTVGQELAFPLECRGAGREEMKAAIGRYAGMFGITHLLERPAHALSGGELQRVLAACALLSEPRFLFLDRPLTEIDFDFRTTFLDIIRSHVRSHGGAALVAEDPWLIPDAPFDRTLRIDPEAKSIFNTEDTGEREERRAGEEESGETGKRSAPRGGMLRVRDLEFAYPFRPDVIEGLSFSLDEGDITFITGPNGSGKTTLARLLTGILTPFSGEISLDGRSFREMRPREIMAKVGLALQNASLHLSRGTVREELESAERWGRPPGALTGILGLDRALETHPLELSQAERKRLAFALAAGGNRRAVVLDEPTQYQDADGFRRMTEAVRRLSSEGKAVLLISHDPRLYREFPGAGEIALEPR